MAWQFLEHASAEHPVVTDLVRSGTVEHTSLLGNYRYFSTNQQYSQRLSSLQTFFQSKGWNDEFIDVGLEEMALQPTNSYLYSTIFNALRRSGVLCLLPVIRDAGFRLVDLVEYVTRVARGL